MLSLGAGLCSRFPANVKTGAIPTLGKEPPSHTQPQGVAREERPLLEGSGSEQNRLKENAHKRAPLSFATCPLSVHKGPTKPLCLLPECLSRVKNTLKTERLKTRMLEMPRTQRGVWSPARATQPDLGSWPAVLFAKRCSKG